MPILPSLAAHRLGDSKANVQNWTNSTVNTVYMCLTHTASRETKGISSADAQAGRPSDPIPYPCQGWPVRVKNYAASWIPLRYCQL